jgi:membrane protein required for colicin V production
MDATGLTGFDAAVIGILLISALMGLSRGITKEVLSIASWVGAAIGTYKLHPILSPYARTYINPQIAADIAVAVGTFVLLLILFSLVFGAISNRVKSSVLGPVDRSLGVLFGLGRGGLVVCLAYLVMALLLPPLDRPSFVAHGQTKALVEQGAIMLYEFSPLSHSESAEKRIRSGISGEPEPPVSPPPRPMDGIETRNSQPMQPSRDPTQPAPAQSADRSNETGYKPDQAQSMDQLIRAHREK